MNKRKWPTFFMWNLVSKFWVVLRNRNWSCADALHFTIRAQKIFFMKILLILPKFHRKTLKRPGDINFFRPGRWMYMYTLPPFMDAVLNEERQLMKWVRILQVGIFWVGNFRLGIFSGVGVGGPWALDNVVLHPLLFYWVHAPKLRSNYGAVATGPG